MSLACRICLPRDSRNRVLVRKAGQDLSARVVTKYKAHCIQDCKQDVRWEIRCQREGQQITSGDRGRSETIQDCGCCSRKSERRSVCFPNLSVSCNRKQSALGADFGSEGTVQTNFSSCSTNKPLSFLSLSNENSFIHQLCIEYLRIQWWVANQFAVLIELQTSRRFFRRWNQ